MPEARFGHGCILIDSIMFIHGGYCEMESRFTNTLYGLNLDTLIWRLYPCTGTYVKERDFHTATGVEKHKIVVFGGRCGRMTPIFTLDAYDEKFYCCDLRNGKWSQMITTGYKPLGRRSHVAACWRESIIYFGGYNSIMNIHFADVFILNITTNHITEVRPWGEYPCARRRPACVLAGSELIICGGTSPVFVEENNDQHIMFDHSDTIVLNLFPSLQEMCLSFILNNCIDYSLLPPHLCSYLAELSSFDSNKNSIIL